MLNTGSGPPGKAVRPISARGLVVLLLLAAAHVNSLRPEDWSPSGEAKRLRIVDLAGTPYQMGLIHGRTLRAEINELVGRWKKDLEATYRVSAEVFIRAFLKKTDFKPAIERWTPGLLDEIRGIADGARIDFDTMYAYQLIDEVWAIGPDVDLAKCTTFAARRRNRNPAYVAQTLDLPAFYHGYQTVLRIRDDRDDLETLVFTIPGVVAANGLNSRSVGVCVNAVTQLAYSTTGLPVDFAVRGILRQGSYEQAVKFLRDIVPAAPQAYVIGGPREAGVFERSAGRMSEFLPFEGAEFSYHTNHPLINDDFNPRFPAWLKSKNMPLENYRGLCPRLNYFRRHLKDNSAAIDLEVLKGIFRDRASGINFEGTYGCTIMVLGEHPELHISPGRPDEAPFQVLGFSPGPGR